MSPPEQLPFADPADPGPEPVAEPAAQSVVGAADAPADEAGPPRIEVRRSARRRRTVTAYREGDRTVVLVPARMSRADEERYVAELVERLDRRERRRRPGDDELERRALELSARWLDGRAQPVSVRWVGNQHSRWGSCTPADGTIRLSDRMRGMPAYVVDSVLVHELAHLVHPDHSPEFWALVKRFPDHDRASAFLDGAVYGQANLTD